MNFTALFCREDSAYKKRPHWDVYDADRDALTWPGGAPCVCHPPCRAWGVLAHMAKPAKGEKELALWAVDQVRKWGGVLEHPKGSKLWKAAQLPEPGWLPDEFGGYTVLIDQYDFGHVANKPTKLYICGCSYADLPAMPPRNRGKALKSMTGQVPKTTRCTQYEREYTPEALVDWLEQVLEKINAEAVGRSPDKRIVETKTCHTHGEYNGPICPECKSPLDMEIPND